MTLLTESDASALAKGALFSSAVAEMVTSHSLPLVFLTSPNLMLILAAMIYSPFA
jgi:hypothetical protein